MFFKVNYLLSFNFKIHVDIKRRVFRECSLMSTVHNSEKKNKNNNKSHCIQYMWFYFIQSLCRFLYAALFPSLVNWRIFTFLQGLRVVSLVGPHQGLFFFCKKLSCIIPDLFSCINKKELRSLFYHCLNGNRKLSNCIHLPLIGFSCTVGAFDLAFALS